MDPVPSMSATVKSFRSQASQTSYLFSRKSSAARKSRPKAKITPFSIRFASGTTPVQMMQRDRAEVEEATQALWTAVHRNNPAGTLTALKNGANIERRDRGWTPLHWAVAGGPQELVDLLLGASACVEVVDSSGTSPLHSAAALGRDAIVIRLIEAGADLHSVGRFGRTPMQWAARNNNISTVALLHSLGAHS